MSQNTLYCKLRWRHRENTRRLQNASSNNGHRIPRWYNSVIATANARAMRIPYNINHGIIRPRLHCRRPLSANRSVIRATGEKIDMNIPKI